MSLGSEPPTNGADLPAETTEQPQLDQLRQRVAELEAQVRELQRYRVIVEQSPVGFMVFDGEARVLEANRSFCRLTGIEQEPQGLDFMSLLGPASREQFQNVVLPLGETTGHWRGRLSGLHPNGTAWTAQFTCFTLREPGDESPRIVAFARDVSAEEQSQEALRASEAQLRTVTDNLPMVLSVIDQDGVFRISTGQGLQSIGLAPGQAVGMSAFELFKENPDIGDDLRRALAGESFDETRRLSERTFEMRYTPFLDANGALAGTIQVALDITERLQIEVDRLLLQEEVIAAQEAALLELSTPLIPVADDVVIMPLIGSIDSKRAQQVLEALLEGVSRLRARTAILDITGVPVVDTQVADALLHAARAVGLLGARVVLTGIGPEVAQTLVQLGADFSGITTRGTLQSAVAQALHVPADKTTPGR